jgi:hypothetical protein
VTPLSSDERHFAKLCLERSTHGQATIVSVVTSAVSDDADAWDVEGDAAWLRISGLTNDTPTHFTPVKMVPVGSWSGTSGSSEVDP